MAKYLVYDNPEGLVVDFVRDTNGAPRVYDDLDLAIECANKQTNGYVVPLGWDCIDYLERAKDADDVNGDVWSLAEEALQVLNES